MAASPLISKAAFRYGMAIAFPALALLVRMALHPLLQENAPVMLFLLSTAAAAWVGGLGPGLLALAIGGALGTFFFILPNAGGSLENPAERARLISFALVGIALSAMAETMHRATRNALHRKRLAEAAHESSSRNARRLQLLGELTRDLLASVDPENLVETICRKVLQQVDADIFLNYLIDAPTGKLRLNASAGLHEESLATFLWLEPGRAVCGAAAREGCRIVLTEAALATDERADLIRQQGFRTYACHPLTAEGQVLGTLGFGSRRRSAFSEDELEFLTTVSDYVALALQRARGTQALRQSEERYRAFVATSHEAIWRIEFDEPIETTLPVEVQVRLYFERAYYAEVNDALAKLYGFNSAAEVPGLRVRSVEPPDNEETIRSIREFITAGYRRTGEVSYEQDRHGNPRNFLNNYVGLVEDGKLVRLWGSSLDITAHRQAQAALAESEAALKAFYESSPAYMGIVELSEDDILHVYDNPATCRIFDVPAGSTQGRWASEMGAAPDVTALWMARYRESAATGKPVTFDYLHRLRGEAARWLSTTVAPIPAGASARPRFCYVSLDTTERHEFELQLANAKEKAEHASRAKDEFLARLSHELRNPLNPVLLTASAEMEDPQRSQEEKDLWRLVYRNISLQARLIDDLLDLTRITRGRLTFNRSIIDTHQVLQDALATVRSDAEAKGHAISVSLDARYVRLYADPARLQQVFWNVLKNAVKFTPKGGAISVKTENPDSHGCLQIVIRDTGLGLTEEELDRIFEPFSQGDHARGKTSHAYGGLGLGLAISREIVQSHHGKIWAASNGRDQGSTFYIELPLAPSAAS